MAKQKLVTKSDVKMVVLVITGVLIAGLGMFFGASRFEPLKQAHKGYGG